MCKSCVYNSLTLKVGGPGGGSPLGEERRPGAFCTFPTKPLVWLCWVWGGVGGESGVRGGSPAIEGAAGARFSEEKAGPGAAAPQ